MEKYTVIAIITFTIINAIILGLVFDAKDKITAEMNKDRTLTISEEINIVERLKDRYDSDLYPELLATGRELVIGIFSEKPNYVWTYNSAKYDLPNVKAVFLKFIKEAAKEEFTANYEKYLHKMVYGERFIDSIIERINKKQLETLHKRR